MRLFVAAELSADVRAAAAACGAQLRDRLQRVRAADGIRWIDPANMHLTVWFLGEVSEARAAAVLEALRPPLTMPAFDVHIAGFGAFPPAGAPRVIWMGLVEGRTELAGAHDLVGERLQPWGFGPEARAYSAHLTIARIRDQRGRARAAVRQAVTYEQGDAGRCRVHELTVFQSRTAPSGAVYEPLLRVPLD
jgi:2'-5' RNA ligase